MSVPSPFSPEEKELRRVARQIVRCAQRSGRIVPGPCVFKGCPHKRRPLELHHDDYTQPLRLFWICKPHHTQIEWWGLKLPKSAEPATILECRRPRRIQGTNPETRPKREIGPTFRHMDAQKDGAA